MGLEGRKHQRNLNTVVIGGSGAGKSFNLAKPAVYVERGMVNTDILNVRNGAGTGYGALGVVTQDMEVDILEHITSAAGQVWYFITYLNSGTRYSGCVLSDYIKTFTSLSAGPSVSAKHGPMDSRVLRITGEGSKIKKLTQTLNISGAAGDVYVVNAWGAADCVPIKDEHTFGTEVVFVNTDGTQDTFNSNFGAAVSDWQYLSDAVVAKKAYSTIRVSLIYGHNANAAYFDGLSFFKEQFGQSFTYDEKGNVLSSKDAAKQAESYEYDSNNNMTKLVDAKGRNFKYTYDSRHNVTSSVSAANCKYTFSYDAYGNPTEGRTVNPSDENEYIRTTAAYTGNGNRIAKVTDALGRLDTRTWNTGTPFVTKYHYMAGTNGSQSSQVASMDTGSHHIAYTYDGNGNITSITDNQGITTYVYDELNRLIRENNHHLGKTVTYLYDAAGNIQKKCTYAMTTEAALPVSPETAVVYAYDDVWRDKLVSVDGRAVTYDAIGNPLTYGAWSMEWTQGKRLASMNSGDGSNTLIFTYDESGMRLSKLDFAGGKNHKYTIAGDKLTGERCETMDGSVIYTTQFIYDSAGEVVSMVYNGVEYYYVRNGQKDIIGLIDGSGNFVVNYTYDSWGKLLKVDGNTELGYRNPLRYRGYIADDETGLYYVGSRYYDPEIGRWISADDVEQLGAEGELQSYNIFAYCLDNPVNRFDNNGNWSLPNWAKIAIGVTAIAVGITAAVVTGGAAAAIPALIAGAKTAVIAGAISAGSSAAVSTVRSISHGESFKESVKKAGKSAVNGFCDGFMWGGIGFGASRTIGAITVKTHIFKRKVVYGKNNYMFGDSELTVWRHGKNFRIDISATKGMHYHMRSLAGGISKHRTKYVRQIYGGIIGIKNAVRNALS